jgi:hypothetical protein
MKGLLKWTVLVLLFICCIQTVSADITVPSLTVDPSGSLTPGVPVTVSYKVDTNGDFPLGGEVQLFTDLDEAKWTYTIYVNDVEATRSPGEGGHTLSLIGFLLRYKPSDDVSVRGTLEGVAPAANQTSNKTILRITEYDANDRIVTSSQVERTALVINMGEVAQTIGSSDAELQVYRVHIDEKAALGIDTSAAEAKYTVAEQDINSARSRPSNEYTAALTDLNAATAAIKEGETALDKAWAEHEVAAAQVPIKNVDNIISWFKGNSSTANDQQLPTIITKREVAVSYISNANDNIADGNYAQARQKAQDAFLKGNESYTEALARQKELSSGFSIPFPKIGGSVFVVIGIVAVILIIVGVIIYRKRSQWDELG